jgi:phosphoglucosamine mutase
MVSETVVASGAHIGIALDGDADRLIVVDEKGALVDGDAIMAICAGELVARNELKKKTLVTTVMSNVGLERAVAKWGVKTVRTRVGDRAVVEEMRRHGYSFGGEQSGHLVFLEHATTGDGTLAALQVLAVLCRAGKPMSELTKIFEPVPQVLLNFQVKEKRELANLPEVQKVIASVEKKLGKDGRVLVRYSGTEAKVRVLVEGIDAKKIKVWAEEIGEALRESLG